MKIDELRFGTFCKLICDNHKQEYILVKDRFDEMKPNKQNTIKADYYGLSRILQGSVISFNSLPEQQNLNTLAGDVRRLKRGEQNISDEVQKEAVMMVKYIDDQNNESEEYKEFANYIKKYICENIYDIEKFLNELKILIDHMPDCSHKEKFLDFYNDDETVSKDKQYSLIVECVHYILIVNNQIPKYMRPHHDVKYDIENGDPHALGYNRSISAAIHIVLSRVFSQEKSYNCNDEEVEFYHFELCTEYILKNGLIITNIETVYNWTNDIDGGNARRIVNVVIYVKKADFILKRLSPYEKTNTEFENDYDEARSLFVKYQNEFRPKISWHGRTIDKLVENGLMCGKWLAYGYYSEGKLIAYLDYKFRTDMEIELGATIVDPGYRNRGLSSSLIFYFLLMFPSLCFAAGTYEENDPMIQTLKKTGFEEHIYGRSGSNKKKDRVGIDNSTEACTYSVYFKHEKLLDVKTCIKGK